MRESGHPVKSQVKADCWEKVHYSVRQRCFDSNLGQAGKDVNTWQKTFPRHVSERSQDWQTDWRPCPRPGSPGTVTSNRTVSWDLSGGDCHLKGLRKIVGMDPQFFYAPNSEEARTLLSLHMCKHKPDEIWTMLFTQSVVSLGASWSADEKWEPCYTISIYLMYLFIHFLLRTL